MADQGTNNSELKSQPSSLPSTDSSGKSQSHAKDKASAVTPKLYVIGSLWDRKSRHGAVQAESEEDKARQRSAALREEIELWDMGFGSVPRTDRRLLAQGREIIAQFTESQDESGNRTFSYAPNSAIGK